MLIKTLPLFKGSIFSSSFAINNFLKDSTIAVSNDLSHSSKIILFKWNKDSPCLSQKMIGSKITYSFSSFASPDPIEGEREPTLHP